ncbi:unnamed protein product [Coffea canephora]|uniref:DH200=94 genomic scaffold, scaffold_3556 n=1 Tax=Coffea canephora TaxID=49390 RepID=A0A068VKX6_COFCA|nr:unnamed protein product [Coffea canephora]
MVPSDSSSSIKVFPSLRYLEIEGLPKLAVLPDMENLTSLVLLSIVECRSLACIRNLNSLTSLECLVLSDCPALLDASLDMKNPQSLRELTISGCDKLNPSLSNNLEKFTSLQRLTIHSDDPGSWPPLVLHHLANLRELELGGFSDDLDHFPWPHSTTNLVSLERLELRGWPKITSLPDQIQHLSNLRTLYIGKFEGLEVLPEWMGSLRNLGNLLIIKCSNLRQLPSAEAMRHLTNLSHLSINRCPLLAERCTKGSGAEWPKIAHIPHIYIHP